MRIVMAGLDHAQAPLELRERLSFSRTAVGELDRRLAALEGVEGCVLLSTCNRTELYLSAHMDPGPDPAALLCGGAGLEELAPHLTGRTGEGAVRHLMAVAAGLESQIFGEDQIITQVKEALTLSRAQGASDAVLEALFREAASAGKELKTKVRLTRAAPSAAARAVDLARERLGDLAGRRALVIGNGEMGRLAAGLLLEEGAAVTVTLRSYHHRETVVPAGCAVAPYEGRYAAMEGADLLFSATASPHCTVTRAGLAALERPPRLLCDLAVPRDIEPEAAGLAGVTLLNMDDLGSGTADRTLPPEGAAILERHLERFYRWAAYRESLPLLEGIKEDITRRVLTTEELRGLEPEELVELAVGRAVDLLSGGLGEGVTPENLSRCAELIHAHTQAAKK